MKKIPALIAAFVVTAVVGVAMLAIGVNAWINPNQVQASSVPGENALIAQTGSESAQVEQLQARIREYQAREQQYQTQLNEAGQLIEQANAELMQYQQLVEDLQARGVIRIDQSGRVFMPRSDHDD